MVNANDLMIRRERLAAELGRLDELLSAFNAYASEFAPELLDGEGDKASVVDKKSASAGRDTRSAKGVGDIVEQTADVVAKAMEESGHPLSLVSIIDIIGASPVPLPQTDDPRNAVGTRISRSGRFRPIRGVGWWFKDRPMPIEEELGRLLAEGNGALNGHAASAPEAGGVTAPPIENLETIKF